MRVSICALADASNIREGALNMLSAGVSQLLRTSFPAPLGAELCVMVQVEEQDLREARQVPVSVRLCTQDGEQIGFLEGDFGWGATDMFVGNIPLEMGLRSIELPRADRYRFEVKVGDLDEIRVPFVAALSDTAAAE